MSERWGIVEGDCVEAMRAMPECSVDAVVCDPPYGLEFMGKQWDAPWRTGDGFRRSRNPADVGRDDAFGRASARAPEYRAGLGFQQWCEAWAREALRVLKPGGHLLAFGGTRTYHRLACAVEDAGFEIRDCLAWLYGSGFPKSLDVSKAIDKAAGAEREVVGRHVQAQGEPSRAAMNAAMDGSLGWQYDLTAPATPDAERWQGWGTALKPAHEPIVLARKPLSGTVSANVLAHGTGALNVDGCRIGEGRWPANVCLDPEAAAMLDEQTGSVGGNHCPKDASGTNAVYGDFAQRPDSSLVGYGDSGGASRFLYVAKSSSAERNAGLDGFEATFSPTMGNGIGGKEHDPETATPKRNTHPTVKPIELMRWLVRLVTPPGGTCLDPFTGSGTTGCAAVLEGFRFVGIEREPEYAAIARARIAWWSEHPDGMKLVERLEAEREHTAKREAGQIGLF
jgi:DNA modification methylase